MLLLRLAGQCVEYAATDFSPVALDNVRREIAKKPEGYRNVTLFECAATDFTGITGPFDVVILNSVIQYFPSIDYLFQVLRGVLALTTPDARIFIGDVRSQPLLEAFHASVELAHAFPLSNQWLCAISCDTFGHTKQYLVPLLGKL